MQRVRRLIRTHRPAIGWLLLLVLAARLLVPGGFMTVATAEGVRLVPCSGWMSASAPDHAMPMVGAHHARGGDAARPDQPDHGKAELPCTFAGLGHAALGGADPVVLALALAFAMLLAARTPATALPRPAPRSWPPAHGPPARA